MADYCGSNITACATDCEWKEISTAFANDNLDWPDSTEGVLCKDLYKKLYCETKWGPTPWEQGYMNALSESYPSVLFFYRADFEVINGTSSAWFCNGNETDISGVCAERKKAYKNEVQRFVSATPKAAEGIKHRVEVMPDGRVAADGENRFGECNIFSWENIKEISCGNWHTVGLKKDGTLVACGSNANGQCNVEGIIGKAVAISCGRYHTAVLLENGKVEIIGKLEQKAQINKYQPKRDYEPEDFPLICELQLDKKINGWEEMNERVERISAGDELTLKTHNSNGEIIIEVLDFCGKKIGQVSTASNSSLSRMLTEVKAFANIVTPLSVKRKCSKYASMEIRIEYCPSSDSDDTKKASMIIGNYKQTCVKNWPEIKRIKSVFDAVIGITGDGEVYVDGYCPCTKSDILKIVGLE